MKAAAPALGLRPPLAMQPLPLPGAVPPGSTVPVRAPMPFAQGLPPPAANQSQVQLEIPQAKVGLVTGQNSAVLNAIKSYSKAERLGDKTCSCPKPFTCFCYG